LLAKKELGLADGGHRLDAVPFFPGTQNVQRAGEKTKKKRGAGECFTGARILWLISVVC